MSKTDIDFNEVKSAVAAINKSEHGRGVAFIAQLDKWQTLHSAYWRALEMTGKKTLSAAQKERMGLPTDNTSPLGQRWQKFIGSIKRIDSEDFEAFRMFVTTRHESNEHLSYTSLRTAVAEFCLSRDLKEPKPFLTIEQVADKLAKLCEDNKIELANVVAYLASQEGE